MRLSEYAALASARRLGVLFLTADAWSQQLCNAFYVHCWGVGRAYVAVDRHGSLVTCDMAPLAGLGRSEALVKAGEARVAAALGTASSALAAAQAAHPGLHLANATTLAAQAAARLPGPTEGSNRHRAPDTAPGQQFTVFTPSRLAAREAALALAQALGAPTPATLAARAEGLQAARRERKRSSLVRRLARLSEDPLAVKNLRVPAGAIEGFVRAREQGLIKDLPPQGELR